MVGWRPGAAADVGCWWMLPGGWRLVDGERRSQFQVGVTRYSARCSLLFVHCRCLFMTERLCMVCMLPLSPSPSAHSYEVSHTCVGHTHEESARTSAPDIVLGHYRGLVDTWGYYMHTPKAVCFSYSFFPSLPHIEILNRPRPHFKIKQTLITLQDFKQTLTTLQDFKQTLTT